MSIAGHLEGVTYDRYGDTLTADLEVGDTVLQLGNTVDFDEESGGSVLVNGTKLDYLPFDDLDEDDSDDDGPTELTLASPSPIVAGAGDRVWAYDPTTGVDDAVTETIALVSIDDRDPGDALPARIRAGLVEQLDSDFETYVGKAVELDVIDGELVLVDILGSTATGEDKFDQDETVAVGPGGVVLLDLKYIPKPNSEHLYIGGVYQRGAVWTRDRWTVSIPDTDNELRAGNKVGMEYAYTDPAPAPVLTYSGPAWHERSGIWGSHPSSFITSVGLPAGTELGDMLVVIAVGDGDLPAGAVIGDPRMTTIASDTVKTIALGYATDLSDLDCHVGGTAFALDQFAGVEILAVRGDGLFAYDPTRIWVGDPVAVAGAIGTVGGSGHGVIAAVAAAYGNPVTLDWATHMPDYDDWGGELATSVGGNFGYCETEPPPAQTNPANAAAVVALIGLK